MRFLALIVAALLWAAPAFAASPSPDGTCNTGATTTACVTSYFTTASSLVTSSTTTSTSSSGCLLVIVATQNISTTAPTVSSISDGASLTFTKRAAKAGTHDDLELWSAPYSARLTADAQTVVLTAGATGNATVQTMAITGTHSGCSFDSHAATTAAPTFSSGVISATQTTNQADDLLIMVGEGSGTGAGGNYSSSTFNSVAGAQVGNGLQNGAGSGNNMIFMVAELGVSATKSGITDTATSSASYAGVGLAITDALTADAATGGTVAHLLTLLGVGP